MEGYWRATVGGREVARAYTIAEALNIALAQGYRQEEVVLDFVYETPRVGY